MRKKRLFPSLGAFFIIVLITLLSIQGSVSPERKNQDKIKPIKNNQETFESLNMFPDYAKMPIYFIPNEGQVDEKALFYAKTSRYIIWLTREGLVFDRIIRIKKDNNKSRLHDFKNRNNPEESLFKRDVSSLIFINSNRNPEVVPLDRTEHWVNYFIGNDKSKWRTKISTSRAILYKGLYKNIDLKIYGIENLIEYDFIVKPDGEVSDICFKYKDIKEAKIDEMGDLVMQTNLGGFKHLKPVCYQFIEGEKIGVEADFKEIEKSTFGIEVGEFDRSYELIIDPPVLVYSTYLGGSSSDFGEDIAVDSTGAAYVTGYTNSIDFPTKNPIQGTASAYEAFITKINAAGDSLVYSTYLGGGAHDYSLSIAIDSQGAVYVTGWTLAIDFPTKNPIQGAKAAPAGIEDAFVTKINAAGDAIVYSTYLGGSSSDFGEDIAVNSTGAACVAGYTLSDDFPTKNPIQGTNAGYFDAFVTKINAAGDAIVYSTYLGGSSEERCEGIAVDSTGAAYVAGYTLSDDFPTQNPYQGTKFGYYDAFVTKINPSGNALVYSTFLGGPSDDRAFSITADSSGAVYITGFSYGGFPTQNPIQGTVTGYYDAFITKINATGDTLLYSTYFGGSSYDHGNSIAIDSSGAAYVTGTTKSTDLPTMKPVQDANAGDWDAFITKICDQGSGLVYSTYLGGSAEEWSNSISIDSSGAACITGSTDSTDFPTQSAIYPNPLGSRTNWECDVFVSKLSSCLCPASFSYASPSNGASNIAIDTNLIWNSSGGATLYDVYFGTSSPPPKVATVTDIFYDPGTLNYITKYYWKIVAKNNYGETSGSEWEFTTREEQYTLTISTTSGGTTNPSPGIRTYKKGTEVEITATPENGYRFSGWTGNVPSRQQNDNPLAITIDSDKSVTASFIEQYTLTIAAGTGGTTNPSLGTYTYDTGTQVNVMATADNGYRFSGWSGDVPSRQQNDNPLAITMDSDKSVTASFIKQYTLTIAAGTGGTTNPSPGTYTYDTGTQVNVMATADNGYRFSGWTRDVPSRQQNDNPLTITMDSDKSITANFIRQYTLSIAAGTGGTTNPAPGSYIYDEGTQVTISCIPDAHCKFSHWSGDVTGTTEPLNITMDSDKSITANFIRIIYAPINFSGSKVVNRSLFLSEYLNALTWQANPNNEDIVKYRIYLAEGVSRSLLTEVDASTFEYWHRKVEGSKHYTYMLASVNSEGREGDPASITVQ